jgi:aspartyl-tRNA synthetase
MEPVITGVFEDFAKGKPVTQSWPRIPFAEALRKYGTDKPDLRNPIVMQDVSEHFRGSGFKVFARMLEDPKNQVWAIPGPGGGSRAFCDRMNSWAQGEGQPGLGYIMWRGEIEGVLDLNNPDERRARDQAEELRKQGRVPAAVKVLEEAQAKKLSKVQGADALGTSVPGAGPLANNIGPERTEAIRKQLGLKQGDAAFFVAGDPAKFWKFAGLARTKLGEELNLIDKDRFELAWVVDFPMYEYNEDEKKIDFSHNPFSMPQGGLDALNGEDPLTIKAFQYDITCNGHEIASGGIRNHRPEAMVKAFEIAGYGEKDVVERFGGMYRAFQYGAPPHGGMAAGVDRIVMLLCGTTNLREISLFPMNQRAEDLLMGAPSEVTLKQLRELHIRLNLPQN